MAPKTHLHQEHTLVILKPDCVQRGIVGEIITRFEKKGLKIVAMKMVWPDKTLAQRHYDQPESAAILLGERTIASYKEKGIELKKTPLEIAQDVQKRLVRYMQTGPVVAMILEGAHAVESVRKIRGHTNPLSADIGSITADLAMDSYFLSDPEERAIRNLVHASGTPEEAEHEIAIWFTKDEIMDYELAIDQVLYDPAWETTRKKLTS